ncbi:stage II sporulation protein P [Garciella nitratireducens]|uniref:stage II sporulation protein P n=1 Tax=Garciella nitratireducens TaxID=218205 RepID=UPI000DEBC474|nr:stage II sporulation protein P [Garciella nitratireducens]RBP45481.1 stage II sporulation protein P [Garciella nitratireducens]
MQTKWKNMIFSITVVVLLIAIIQQGNILMNNIRKSTTVFENETISETTTEQKVEKSGKNKKLQQSKTLKEKENSVLNNDFLKIILKKGITMMETAYKMNGDESDGLLSSLFIMSTNINIKDPKTILSSQIPMLDSYESDDVKISKKEQKALHKELTQKPMNDVEVANVNPSRSSTKRLDNKEPLVLIYHTHATESYTSTDEDPIEYVSPWRTLDNSKNMVRIGEEIKKVLEEEYGIKVIHDTTLHDYPNYDVSYSRSLQTVEKILKENPSIKYVFDVHRDGLAESKENRNVSVAVFGKQQSAKVMMVVGKDNFNADKNLNFTKKIEEKMNENYPGITKSLIARKNRKYNQFVSDYATLIEVGSNLNTLKEALEASQPIGHAIGEVILELEQQE